MFRLFFVDGEPLVPDVNNLEEAKALIAGLNQDYVVNPSDLIVEGNLITIPKDIPCEGDLEISFRMEKV